MKTLQNFYKATITIDWTIGTGNFYVSTKPTVTNGWLVVSPNNSTLREIVAYTNTGTDSNGDYVTVSARGVGGTTEQTHGIGEPIRMNITAEYWADMTTDISDINSAGAVNASTSAKGLVQIATASEVIAGTVIGSTGAALVPTPDMITKKLAISTTLGTFSVSLSGSPNTSTGDVYSIAIPGGTLGTNNAIKFTMQGDSGGSPMSVRIWYGSQMIASSTPNGVFTLVGEIIASGTTNSQVSRALYLSAGATSNTYTALTIDSTISQNLRIEGYMNVGSGVSGVYTVNGRYIIVEKIN